MINLTSEQNRELKTVQLCKVCINGYVIAIYVVQILHKYSTNLAQILYGRITTLRKKLLNSLRTSKQGHALMYSAGSTSPLLSKSGDVSR